MFSFVFCLGIISSTVNVFTEFFISKSHINFSKFSHSPYVNLIQSAGFHFGRGGGGGQGWRKHKNRGEKNPKRMNLFQEKVVFPPYRARVGGPSYAPFGKGASLRDTLTTSKPERSVSKNGGGQFLKDGLYVDNSAVSINHFYINKFSILFKCNFSIFTTCTGLSEPEPFSLNFFDFLNLVFLLIFKHGFK